MKKVFCITFVFALGTLLNLGAAAASVCNESPFRFDDRIALTEEIDQGILKIYRLIGSINQSKYRELRSLDSLGDINSLADRQLKLNSDPLYYKYRVIRYLSDIKKLSNDASKSSHERQYALLLASIGEDILGLRVSISSYIKNDINNTNISKSSDFELSTITTTLTLYFQIMQSLKCSIDRI